MFQLRYIERWVKKSIPQILGKHRPDVAFTIAIEMCRHLPLFWNRDDIRVHLDRKNGRIKKLFITSFKALAETVTAWNHE